MSGKNYDEPTSEQLLEQIRRLQEQVRQLQDRPGSPSQAPDGPPDPATQGLAEGIATALGKMVPGLGQLLQIAAQDPQFGPRLAAIDEQVKRKFKDQPLGRAATGLGGIMGQPGHPSGNRQMGIPPAVRDGRRATLGRSAKAPGPADGGKGHQAGNRYRRPRGETGPGGPKVHITPHSPEQLAVDVFDEGRQIVVLAEAPGLRLEELAVALAEADVLVISVRAAGRSRDQRVELPCRVVGQPKVSLRNGILRIQASKFTNRGQPQ